MGLREEVSGNWRKLHNKTLRSVLVRVYQDVEDKMGMMCNAVGTEEEHKQILVKKSFQKDVFSGCAD